MTHTAQQMNDFAEIALPGYQYTATIYSGRRTTVYRAIETATQQPVIIKVLSAAYPTFAELVRFRNQYTITQNLDIPGIVEPCSLEVLGNRYALVMDDLGCASLEHYIQEIALDCSEALEVGIQLAEVLHRLHQAGVIHKDIKPANILIHPETKTVKLIDFSIASLLPTETQAPRNPRGLEGTLAYLAPEQSGRMNRGIDYRTDFYALGVTLYQLLAGELPFVSDDPMELIHDHMTRVPTALDRIKAKIPNVVARVVAKLMEKNAEERYQSALGLKHDLERCREAWQEQGEIVPFVLGQRDASDRFSIPEKLYGRETEVAALLAAFDRASQGQPELMLVAGFSGIGKTAVINEIHKPIVRQRGYFVKGKFDQFNRNVPFSAFVQAFRELVGQLLSESDAARQAWKTQLLEAFGDNAQVVIDLLPELETLLGKQPPAPELSGTAAQNRFNSLFQKFVRVFATPEHPLAMFVDDLQWADSASLGLIQLLMAEAETSGTSLLLLGAYRDNEVFPAHPLTLALGELGRTAAPVSTIALKPLESHSLDRLISETLRSPVSVVQPLTTLVMQKTRGNPFFATQFLKSLHQAGTIVFDREAGHWQCSLDEVREASLTDDVVVLMTAQLQKLPAATQELLKLAACAGAQFDVEALAIVCDRPVRELATELWPSLQAGLVVPQNNIYKFYLGGERNACSEARSQLDGLMPKETQQYRFLHDRVQQAAYSLLDEAEKQQAHLKIGRQLWHNLPDDRLDEQLFAVVNHLNGGGTRLDDPAERMAVTALNLRAAQKAKRAIAYDSSSRYCQAGRAFLDGDFGASGSERHGLWFELALLEAEMEFFRRRLEVAEKLAETILDRTDARLERVRVHELQILFEIDKGQMVAAIELTVRVLAMLDIHIPTEPEAVRARVATLRQEMTLSVEDIAAIVDRPTVTDPEKLAALRVLSNATSAVRIASPLLYPLVVLQTAQYCLQSGNSPLAAAAYSWHGALLCGTYRDIDAGYAFGLLALALLDKFNASDLIARTAGCFHSFIRPWKEPLHRAVPGLLEAGLSGFDNGDMEYGLYETVTHCIYSIYIGTPLEELRDTQAQQLAIILRGQYSFHQGFLAIGQQFVANLLGSSATPQVLDGELFDRAESLTAWKQFDLAVLLFCFAESQTRLAYLFEDYEAAAEAADAGYSALPSFQGSMQEAEYRFMASLSYFASENCDASRLALSATHQEHLQLWVRFAPENFQHKYDLVEAERLRVLGDRREAFLYYERAIEGAKAHNFLPDEALANERAAKFYLDWGKQTVAAGYMQEAYYRYSQWGAKAKALDLERRYPDLLQPILLRSIAFSGHIGALETLSPPTATATGSTGTRTHQSSTSTSANDTLNFVSVLRASQALSQTIELDELMRQLTHILLLDSGGDGCILALPEDDGASWSVRAIATSDTLDLESTPLGARSDVPTKLIQYVKNTREAVAIDALHTELPVLDAALEARNPGSVLCLPLLSQTQLIGVLYLENRLTRNVFTVERLTVLNLLCTQAAISLENARLYQQSQRYAQQLEQSQLQLVQSEKLATLGNLVAGVAHEVNNPIGFLRGSISNATEYIDDLFAHLETYQAEHPPNEAVRDSAEEIDLGFLQSDLPNLLTSMEQATQRITEISKSLRTFSRADTAHKVEANLHDGLESTLLILKYRLKANDRRPAIEVVRDYGDLPPVRCFLGQLNQVFMNVLANAIDMFDDVARDLDFADCPKQTIAIRTRCDTARNTVTLRIADNGTGMPEDIRSRVFERLFTTKGVGKGTGLGLAIAQQIVVEKHGGRIHLDSTPGEGTTFAIELPLPAD